MLPTLTENASTDAGPTTIKLADTAKVIMLRMECISMKAVCTRCDLDEKVEDVQMCTLASQSRYLLGKVW